MPGRDARRIYLCAVRGTGEFKGRTLVCRQSGESTRIAGVSDDVGHGDANFIAALAILIPSR